MQKNKSEPKITSDGILIRKQIGHIKPSSLCCSSHHGANSGDITTWHHISYTDLIVYTVIGHVTSQLLTKAALIQRKLKTRPGPERSSSLSSVLTCNSLNPLCVHLNSGALTPSVNSLVSDRKQTVSMTTRRSCLLLLFSERCQLAAAACGRWRNCRAGIPLYKTEQNSAPHHLCWNKI